MSKKSILILKIILIILAILILLIALLWFFYNKKDSPITNNEATVNERNNDFLNRNNNINSNINQQNSAVNVAEFTSIAKLAAERFGSYSSDTHNFANLRDMQYLMTDQMKQWTDNFISNLSIDFLSPQEYYGVTTKSLSVETINYNEKQDAEVVVSCQRIEIKNKNNPIDEIRYQGVRIKMLYVNEKWLIDELRWE